MEIIINDENKHDIRHIVCDFNGTIACDGDILPGVRKRFAALKKCGVTISVITADTHGTAAKKLAEYACEVEIITDVAQDKAKETLVRRHSAKYVCAIGNGRNDRLMLKEAAIGIAVIQIEGCATEAMLASDIVVKDINDALDLILNPLRARATLRL